MESVKHHTIIANGIRQHYINAGQGIRVTASTEGSAVQGAHLVHFCVKSIDTESGAAAIKPHLVLDAVVLSLQNGVGKRGQRSAAARDFQCGRKAPAA
jgi:ketopantoate reductase